MQKTISYGEPYFSAPLKMLYIYREGTQVAIVKATVAGDELYLVSMRKISGEDQNTEREILRLIKNAKAGGGASRSSKS